ncbi:hypothetical protein LK996_02230 [Lysobacter sp. A6]|uniref:Uncharacterized protein n=1 Tax=Noviluteimonas lactosilytica TaxID=2888523 RepID=A0ABS8JE70_9GAMM|nr:hypothetical protein [Lysobacter lactosilyticus]MCC8361902.1 hypothetical protein [Lysobacter lactosilyticus]
MPLLVAGVLAIDRVALCIVGDKPLLRGSDHVPKFVWSGLLALAMAGCASETEPTTLERLPEKAGQPLDPTKTAARIVAMRGQALVGDKEGLQRNVEGMQEDMRRSMKLADGRRPIDREQARAVIRGVSGVRSVAWVDRANLLVIVDRNEARTYATIDEICLALEPLGDTLAVVVNLQSGAATSGDELEVLSRNCQLEPGDRALLQTKRDLNVIAPETRVQHKASQARASDQARDRRKEQEEAMRILEATTPEM